MSFLTDLAEQLARAADRLEHGNEYQRAWAAHFRSDRKAVVLLAETWRDPDIWQLTTTGSAER